MKVCHFCGADNEDWMKICQVCGNPIIDTEKKKKKIDIKDTNDNKEDSNINEKKGNNNDLKIIIAIMSVILVVLIIYTVYVVISDSNSDNNNNNNNSVENNNIVNDNNNDDNDNIIENTKWVDEDNSEIAFEKNTFKWYKEKDKYDDNYYSGKYEFYIGDEALDFITSEENKYNIELEELEKALGSDKDYNRENFVIISLNYDEQIINDEKQELDNKLEIWFGFMSSDHIYLDVINMVNASQYFFIKQ